MSDDAATREDAAWTGPLPPRLGDIVKQPGVERVKGKARCAECRKRFPLDSEGISYPPLVELMKRQLSGEAPVLCPACQATADAAEEARQATERTEAVLRSRLASSGIPPKWLGLKWADLDRAETTTRAAAVTAAEAWAEGRGDSGLLLIGSVGVGKTRITATAAFHRLAVGRLRWVFVPDLLMRLSLPFDSPERAKAVDLLTPGARGSALVLDDLDKARPTEHAMQPLFLAINAWIEAEQPLAVTMNRPLADLADRLGDVYGEPIASRLAEHCAVFELSGRDRRVEP